MDVAAFRKESYLAFGNRVGMRNIGRNIAYINIYGYGSESLRGIGKD